MGIVYLYTNKLNGVYYIGKTKNPKKRYRDHSYALSNSHFHRAIKKYGWNNFSYKVLDIAPDSELEDLEEYYIEMFSADTPKIGYNETSAGKKPFFNKLAKKNMSNSSKGKKITEKQRIALLSHCKGEYNGRAKKVICVETQEIFNCIKDIERKYSINHSHISAACRGRYKVVGGYHWSYYNNTLDIDTKKNKDSYKEIRPLSKKVKCMETNKIYRSIGEAGRDTKISSSSISRCCSGKIETVKNFHWAYYKEEN